MQLLTLSVTENRLNPMPEINFFTEERMAEFWGYVQMLLKTSMPSVMMVVALMAAGMIITIVIAAFKKAASDKEEKDDDDYEIRHYQELLALLD